MQEELNRGIDAFFEKWDTLKKTRKDTAFFEGLIPFTVAWKTTDMADFDARFLEMRDKCDLIFYTWLNERWATKMHLREGTLSHGITIIKLLQRRPGSTDPVGLDHIDFFAPANPDIQAILAKEPDLQWEEEHNGIAEWQSVRFDHTEAKLRTETVWDVVGKELLINKKEILEEYAANS